MKEVCIVCQEPTKNRCSRCRSVYYCCAEHQKEHREQHRSQCVEPFEEFIVEDMFQSYYDGALMVYLYATTFEFDNDQVDTIFQRFVASRVATINGLVEKQTAKSEQGTLDFQLLTENRAKAIRQLDASLNDRCKLTDDQKRHLEPLLAKHREQLKEGDKPMGYVCGYAHSALEIMQRLLQADLGSKERATELGAAALATCTIALQVALERLTAHRGAETQSEFGGANR